MILPSCFFEFFTRSSKSQSNMAIGTKLSPNSLSFSIISFIGIIYVLYVRLFTLTWVPGWAAILLVILLSSGIQMICIGILGEYIGNIFFETKNRPLYIVEEKKVLNKK